MSSSILVLRDGGRELDGKRIAAYHGTAPLIVTALAKCGDYDLVCYGHNHLAKIEWVVQAHTLNPGTLMEKTTDTIQGVSVGVYDTTSHTAELFWLKR